MYEAYLRFAETSAEERKKMFKIEKEQTRVRKQGYSKDVLR